MNLGLHLKGESCIQEIDQTHDFDSEIKQIKKIFASIFIHFMKAILNKESVTWFTPILPERLLQKLSAEKRKSSNGENALKL